MPTQIEFVYTATCTPKNRWAWTIGVMIVILVPALYLYLLIKTPLSFKELDFDDNGIVTFSELIHANSNCYRVTLNGQVICKE